MKRILFIFSCIITTSALHAQVLYGTTVYGGANGGGAITKFVTSSHALTAAFSFDAPDGASPYYSAMMQASDGKLYGTTTYGGNNDNGIIFSLDPATGTYTNLWRFDGANGSEPEGNLVQASNGKLYGMTSAGGSNYNGVIFSFDPATGTYTKLKDFDGSADGSYPGGSLMQASNGKLYGMTSQGGSNGAGVIFSFDPADASYSDLKDLDNTADGGNPNGSLVQASNGKLYGLTYSGGSNGVGTVFSFDPATNSYSNLKDLDNTTDGGNPYGSLVQASNGKLYGLTSQGGSNGSGVIFSFNPATNTYNNLKDLNYNNTDGGTPYGSLVQANNGKLYGINFYGGVSGNGLIFSFDPTTTAYTTERYLGTNNTGNELYGGLLKDNTGKLFYGMTSSGGSNGVGVIFSFNPATGTYTNLWNFNGANGASPYGSLVQTSDGKLYGMTINGGSDNAGVMFSFDPATATFTKLKEFSYSNGDGVSPFGSLVQANDKLYGMTSYGGRDGAGTIFSFDPADATFTNLKYFGNDNDGGRPNGSLVQASDGKLYGMTSSGGGFYGVIFSFDPVSADYTKLKDFDYYNDGANPYGSLVQASNGKLYGMTYYAGSAGAGTMFSFDPTNAAFTKIKDFDDNVIGGYPEGSLMQASNGKLYGMTYSGGSNDSGVVFSFDPATTNFAKLQDYKGTNGATPGYTYFTELTPLPKLIINDVSITEGNSGTKNMRFKVTLSAASAQTVTVNYKTVNKTAIAPSDYTAVTGTLTFAPGVRAQPLIITIVGDNVVEPDESFKVVLGNPVNATIKDCTGIGAILNDDKATISNTITASTYSSAPSITISPNPAISITNVQLMGYTGSVFVQLTDMQGKVLKETKVQAANMKYAQQQFNVAGIANGTYFIVVQDEHGNRKSEKVIVAH